MTAEVRALGPIRDAFRAGAWDELERTATDATAWLYAGVLALASDPERASRWLRRAADEAGPDRRLARALARHVDADRDRELSSSLYETQPDAFAAFVDGGTNPALYRATATALGAGRARPQSVLDIGTGDGRALVAFLDELGARPARIDAVEPAPDLAARLTARLADRGLAGRLHPTTLQRFSADLAADARWQVGVATFSLHTLAPDERRPCLERLARHVDELAVVDFDVPDFDDDRGPERFGYCAARYERGLLEYDHDPLVVDGFLIPVFLGGFVPGRRRSTFEQSSARWVDELGAAGFTATAEPFFDYWWAPATLWRARPVAERAT